MGTATASPVVLEPIAQSFADGLAAAGGPPLYTLTPEDARAVLDRLQAGPVALAPAEVEEHAVPGGPSGQVSVTVVRPKGALGALPVVASVLAAGWILGNYGTRQRLVRDLAHHSRAAFVFVNYPRSPEARDGRQSTRPLS